MLLFQRRMRHSSSMDHDIFLHSLNTMYNDHMLRSPFVPQTYNNEFITPNRMISSLSMRADR